MTAPIKYVTVMTTTLLLMIGACAAPDTNEMEVALPSFETDMSWPMLPPNFEWGQIIGIATASRGHVWTSSRSEIAEWDRNGTLVQSWSARGPEGNWSVIHGLFIDHNDFVWTNARESNLTLKFSRDGQHLMTIGRFDETGGSNDTELMGRPAEIWVDPDDNEVFVADGYANRRVIVFDGETGEYLRHWGAYGARPDDAYRPDPTAGEPSRQFRTPHGISGSRDGLIYVADRANNRIQVFRQDGTFVTEKILRQRCAPEDQPEVPECGREAAFSVGFSSDDAQTYLYVADGGSHVIVVLRRSDLEKVDEFGGPGTGPGLLGRPHNLAVDLDGNLFVAEAAGPWIVDPARGDSVQAGFRPQKFTLNNSR